MWWVWVKSGVAGWRGARQANLGRKWDSSGRCCQADIGVGGSTTTSANGKHKTYSYTIHTHIQYAVQM